MLNNSEDNNEKILQHIRGYAKQLDQEKNKIFSIIGIDEKMNYKLLGTTENIKLLQQYLNTKLTHYLMIS